MCVCVCVCVCVCGVCVCVCVQGATLPMDFTASVEFRYTRIKKLQRGTYIMYVYVCTTHTFYPMMCVCICIINTPAFCSQSLLCLRELEEVVELLLAECASPQEMIQSHKPRMPPQSV